MSRSSRLTFAGERRERIFPLVRISRRVYMHVQRAIEILIRATVFKCISRARRYGAPESRRNVSRSERHDCFACHGRHRALIFHRVTYLSIPRRTIGFNEAEIENTTVRARAVCATYIRLIIHRRMSGTTSPCISRDCLPSVPRVAAMDYVLLNYSGA